MEGLFSGRPSIPAGTVHLNRQPVTIVGVALPHFHDSFPGSGLTAGLRRRQPEERDRGARHFKALVRLNPRVSIAEANAEAATVAARLARAFPKINEGVGADGSGLEGAIRGAGIQAWPMSILGVACGLLLLIACANVANLLPARSAASPSAPRGAGPGRLTRQLVSESMLRAALATLAGLPLAVWFQNVLSYFVPPTGLPVYLEVNLSGRVFVFVALLAWFPR